MKCKNLLFFFIFCFCSFPNSSDKLLRLDTSSNNVSEINVDQNNDAIKPFCSGVEYDKLSVLNYSDLVSLNIETPNSLEWYKNLARAYLDNGGYPRGYIQKKYKKIFNAQLVADYGDFSCNFDSEIRISGDWKDHIDIKNSIASLDIKLLEGNIFGVTKFKLILPESRNGDNEILVTSIFSELGFITPKTFYANVNMNNMSNFKYIFQEKLSKELIESHGYREGPLLEINEKYYWETSTGQPFNEEELIFTNAKLLNSYWARRSEINAYISLLAIEKLNYAIFTTKNSNEEYLNFSEVVSDNKKIFEYDTLALSFQAAHALRNHNRKFYFNRITNEFEPIYYDGNSTLLNIVNKDVVNKRITDFLLDYEKPQSVISSAESILNAFNENKIDFQSIYNKSIEKGAEFNYEKFKEAINTIRINLEFISSLNIEDNSDEDIFIDYSIYNKISEAAVFYDFNTNNFLICDSKIINCDLKTKSSNNNIFDKQQNQLNNYYLIGFTTELNESSKELKSAKFDDLNIFYIGTPIINVDSKNKNIKIIINNSFDRVLIKDSNLESFKIYIDGNSKEINNSASRINENLLTGCISFYKTDFLETEIYANNLTCEDSVNLINVNGEISELNIQNSKEDALDIDFSEIYIKNLNILNAGNDCLDISGSILSAKDLKLESCGDKGVSVGEKSNIELFNVKLVDSNLGIAIKDSSASTITNFEGLNIDTCISIYRKKEEFGPSYLKIYNQSCNSINFIQIGSKFES